MTVFPNRDAATDANAVFQDRLRERPWAGPGGARLPGIQPLRPDQNWLRVDEAYGAQMALRRRLIAERPQAVLGLLPQAEGAAQEALALVEESLPALGFARDGDGWICPDGVRVSVDRSAPMASIGRLIQSDFCLMQAEGAEHALAGAVLCFPARWLLAEKLGRPMTVMHRPIASYTDDLARRVQRLFDAIRPEQPLWRCNALFFDDPALHQPMSETDPRSHTPGPSDYLRTEFQVLRKLPQSGAVAFVIHTSVLPRTRLDAEDAAAMDAYLKERAAA